MTAISLVLLLSLGVTHGRSTSGRNIQKFRFNLPHFRPDPNHPFTITVEGNVGAGKSTLLNYFGQYPEVAVHKEPVELWQNVNGTNFLDLMLNDPTRNGFAFESLVALSMTEIHMADHELTEGSLHYPVKIMERSLESCRKVFVESLRSLLSPGEVAILDGWYHLLVDRPEFDTKVDLTVYLRTNPEVAYQRMKTRARKEEQGLELEHFQRMHRLHEDWLVGPNKTVVQPVIVINADEDISTLQGQYRRLAKAVWRATNKSKKSSSFSSRKPSSSSKISSSSFKNPSFAPKRPSSSSAWWN